MAAVICNCLREERRILSTASMQEQVLPRHMTNSMQKPQIPRATMLLTKLQSFALTWYYIIPVWDPKGASFWPSLHGQYYKCTYSTCDLVQCIFDLCCHVLDVYIYFIFRSSVFHVSISLMAGTTGEVNAKLSHLGEAESSWQQSGSHKKQRSGKLRPVLVSVITAMGV